MQLKRKLLLKRKRRMMQRARDIRKVATIEVDPSTPLP